VIKKNNMSTEENATTIALEVEEATSVQSPTSIACNTTANTTSSFHTNDHTKRPRTNSQDMKNLLNTEEEEQENNNRQKPLPSSSTSATSTISMTMNSITSNTSTTSVRSMSIDALTDQHEDEDKDQEEKEKDQENDEEDTDAQWFEEEDHAAESSPSPSSKRQRTSEQVVTTTTTTCTTPPISKPCSLSSSQRHTTGGKEPRLAIGGKQPRIVYTELPEEYKVFENLPKETVLPILRGIYSVYENRARYTGVWGFSDLDFETKRTSTFEYTSSYLYDRDEEDRTPHNGFYGGFFHFRPLVVRIQKIKENEIEIHFLYQKENKHFQAFGKGKNKFGFFLLYGHLNPNNGMLELKRHYIS
jgi:hypothetical protein